MRFSTIFASVLAGCSTFAFAQSSYSGYSTEELILRNDGDVNILMGRDVSPEEIAIRDAAYAAVAGGDSLESRGMDHLSSDDMADIVRRHVGFLLDEEQVLAARDLIEYDELNTRVVGAVVRGAQQVVKIIMKVINVIKGKIEKDKQRRGQYTSEFIGQMLREQPKWNWAICHTKHTTKFTGKQGKDWFHRHEEFPVSFGKTIGFEIYWFKGGQFIRHGDGGYLNWAYGGKIQSKSKDGKTITFGKK